MCHTVNNPVFAINKDHKWEENGRQGNKLTGSQHVGYKCINIHVR